MVERTEDGPVGPRSTVWMVSIKTGLGGRKGQVWLEPGVLVFRPASNRWGDTRIRTEHIRRVKQARFTPVLDLRLRAPDQPERMGFYFVQPPSLDTGSGGDGGGSIRERATALVPITSPKRRARKDAASALREANPVVRDEVAAWVSRIRKAMASR